MKRDSDCPLCGARLTPAELLDACGELLSPDLGVLAARCPYCQGYIEVRPAPDSLQIGYLTDGATPVFQAVISLPCDGIALRSEAGGECLKVTLGERNWLFSA